MQIQQTEPFVERRGPLQGSSPQILVAEDDPLNREVAVRMLERLGFRAETACNGEQAASLHAEAAYDLILMDCDMPVLDGLLATQRIRAGEGGRRRTPIVALTAGSEQDRARCLAAGMDDFLAKPLRPEALQAALTRWLFGNPAGVAPSPPCADADELDAVRAMFGAGFAELAGLFRRDSPPRLAGMREARASADRVRLASLAHAQAGSSASLGATGLSARCKALEACARAGSLDDIESRLAGIEAEYRRICGRLEALLARG